MLYKNVNYASYVYNKQNNLLIKKFFKGRNFHEFINIARPI